MFYLTARTLVSLCVGYLFMAAAANACRNIPEHQTQTLEQLVTRTNTIVLAQAGQPQRITGDFYSIEFTVIESLKGNQQGRFTITGFLAKDQLGRYDYDKHNNLQFWAYSNTGNFTRTNDCRVFGHFEQGRQYLVFVDEPFHPRSFEVINAADDSWLADVRKTIEKLSPPAPASTATPAAPIR